MIELMATEEEESREEAQARALLERELGQPFRKVAPGAAPTCDHRSVLGPPRSVEVKRLTSQGYLEVDDAFSRHGGFREVTGLSWHWSVGVERPTLSTVMRPMPRFPDDDPQTIDALARDGLRVTPKEEREAEWRRRAARARSRPMPRLASLAERLRPHLTVLERHGIRDGIDGWSEDPEVRAALRSIRGLVGEDGMVLGVDPTEHQPCGVELFALAGYVRTGDPNTVVGRLQVWLEDDNLDIENLRLSLRAEVGRERHAVVLFDSSTEPEVETARELGLRFVPTAAIDLPPEVNVLWAVIGPVSWCYDPMKGWRSMWTPSFSEE